MVKKILFIGLRNPEVFFNKTRHNFGYMLVEQFVSRYGNNCWNKESKYMWSECSVDGITVIAIAPKVNINLSSQAVERAMKKHSIELDKILVAYDDFEVPFGKWKFKESGSAKGHNGIRDLVRRFGDKFIRMRLGIGFEEKVKIKLCDYVLSKFSLEELETIEENAEDMCNAVRQKCFDLSQSQELGDKNEEK